MFLKYHVYMAIYIYIYIYIRLHYFCVMLTERIQRILPHKNIILLNYSFLKKSHATVRSVLQFTLATFSGHVLWNFVYLINLVQLVLFYIL
jgi:hypothetical protein